MRLNRHLGITSIVALAITWLYFGFVVWMSDHPSVANYVYTTLGVNTMILIGKSALIGVIAGLCAVVDRRIWFIPFALNSLKLVLIVLSPKAVL